MTARLLLRWPVLAGAALVLGLAAPSAVLAGPDLADDATCLTPLIARSIHAPSTLTETERARVAEAWRPRGRGLREGWTSYVSPSGRFEMHYTDTGLDAVDPADDAPANGIPDLVENCAIWADRSWVIEVDSLGYPPPLLPADGTYDMTFINMGAGGLLGYAFPDLDEAPGVTEIRLRRGFRGAMLIPTEDPDGNPTGRAKCTVAHEFRHAIQHALSGWVEGDWLELDANWVMDVVFDESNAYIGSLRGSGSQLSNPEHSLDHGGWPGYADLLWEVYLAERWSAQSIHEYWMLRAATPTQPVLDTFADAQALHGATWTSSYAEFMEWCWFSGTFHDPTFGFEESDRYPDVALRDAAIETYPYAVADSVAHLACHHRRGDPGPPVTAPRVLLDADDAAPGLTVSVMMAESNGTITIVRPPLDGSNACDYTVPHIWAELDYVGVTITNGATAGPDVPYAIDIRSVGATSTPEPIARAVTLSAFPNPFSCSTTITSALGRPGTATLRIVDVAGRAVRTIRADAASAGSATFVWDGRRSDGSPAPTGVYLASIRSGEATAARKLVRVRAVR